MSNIFDISDNHGLTIYTYQQQILLCDKIGRFFGRPVVLARDYAEYLNAIAFQDTIYYTYISTENQLVLRSIISESTYINTHNTDSLLSSPQLIIFNDKLLLFYISFSQTKNSYSVHCSTPLDKKEDFIIDHPFSPLPHITISPAENHMMLHVFYKSSLSNSKINRITDNSDELYILDEKMHVTSITEQTNIIMSDCERKLEQATHNHDKEKKHWEQTLQTYTVKINQLEQTSQIDKTEIDRLSAVIDSITHQYNELMNVAQQYRDEAKKWHDMFLSRDE